MDDNSQEIQKFNHLSAFFAGVLYTSLLFSLFLLGCASLPPARKEPAKVPVIEKDPFEAFPGKYRKKAIEAEKREEWRKALFMWQVVRSFIPDDDEASKKIKVLEDCIQSAADIHFKKGLEYFQKNSLNAARKEFLITLIYNPDHKQALDYLKRKLTDPAIIYEIKEGDTLKSIANEIYHDSEKDFLIAFFNDLETSETLNPGMAIKLPIIDSLSVPKASYKPFYPVYKSSHPDDMLRKAKTFFEARRYEKALSLSEKILERSPSNKEAIDIKNASYYQLGTILLKKKEYQKSLKMFKNVDPLYRDVKEIIFDTGKNIRAQAEEHYAKGVRYFLAEELDKAIKEWGKTLRLDPGHSEAKRDIEKARRLLENLKKFQ
jgi:tetratricopeptide (TPR) repeat protein